MRYFHCPRTYRARPYGCGAGPYNGTQAFLDYGQRCPVSGHALKPYHPARIAPLQGATCAVLGLNGETYCSEPTASGKFCRRHAYLAVTNE